MRQSLPLMHFYSGKLLQFYSGVDRLRNSLVRISEIGVLMAILPGGTLLAAARKLGNRNDEHPRDAAQQGYQSTIWDNKVRNPRSELGSTILDDSGQYLRAREAEAMCDWRGDRLGPAAPVLRPWPSELAIPHGTRLAN
jgi:hypothetical protein